MSDRFPNLLEPQTLEDWYDRTAPVTDSHARVYTWCGAPRSANRSMVLTFDDPMVVLLHRNCGHHDSRVLEGDAKAVVGRLDAEMAARLMRRPLPQQPRQTPRPSPVQLWMTTEERMEAETEVCGMDERPGPSGCPTCDASA